MPELALVGTVIVMAAVAVVVVELRVTVVGVMTVESPEGDDEEESLIVSENPFDPIRVRVALPVAPAARLVNIGFTLMLKEGATTWTVMNMLLEVPLLEPVTTRL